MEYWQRLLVSVMVLLSVGACAAKPTVVGQRAEPPSQTVERESYRLVLKPMKKGGNFFSSFLLTLGNKTATTIEIDWNRTRYILDGKNAGGFVFAGITPSDVKAGTIPSDAVSAGETLQREIAPARFIAFAPYRDTSITPGKKGISAGPLPDGKSGISLALQLNGREIRENVAVDIRGGN